METNNYELIIAATTAGSESLISRVEKFLKEAEALDLKVDKLGKKQLAYPIKKQTEADYFVLNFQAEGANLKSITDKLRLEQEDVLRYMLLSAKVYKPSKRKGKKAEPAFEEGKKEVPKVTVVTKTSIKKASPPSASSPAKAAGAKKALGGKKIAKVKKTVKSKGKK